MSKNRVFQTNVKIPRHKFCFSIQIPTPKIIKIGENGKVFPHIGGLYIFGEFNKKYPLRLHSLWDNRWELRNG